MNRMLLCVAALALAWCSVGVAQIIVPGADGSDGAFSPTTNTVVPLQDAPSGPWNGPNTMPGKGVYDPNQWAVVYRFTSVNIPANVTVTFTNHPSRAPVVWLVSGNVTINGTINLNGQQQTNVLVPAEPGPGGFRGGRRAVAAGQPGSAGFGPGAGDYPEGTGSYGTLGNVNQSMLYGSVTIFPLIGGSGGGGIDGLEPSYTSGAGGGALLIACQQTLTFNGLITARGGDAAAGAGSGGGIRLIANSVVESSPGAGRLRAEPGNASLCCNRAAGRGRIRIEISNAGTLMLADPGIPAAIPSVFPPATPAKIFPDGTNVAGSIRIVSVGKANVPTDPRATLTFPQADVQLTAPTTTMIFIETKKINTTSFVRLRLLPFSVGGADAVVNATFVSGDFDLATWRADVNLPVNYSVIQAWAQ